MIHTQKNLLWLEVEHTSIKYILYRHPNNRKTNIDNFVTNLERTINIANSPNKPLIIIGDLNINLIDNCRNNSVNNLFNKYAYSK